MNERISWRGTWGAGDFMMALNACHQYAYTHNVKVDLTMHWHHEEDYIEHFEDPETIVSRMHYIHNFYNRQEDVTIHHDFNHRGEYFYGKTFEEQRKHNNKNMFKFESDNHCEKHIPSNDWLFRSDAFKSATPNKIVIWRPMFNSEPPRYWKRLLTNDDWCSIIVLLRRKGMNIVELTYRTPIAEVMYHISTCRMVLCYDGMWHYIAKNFAKPMLVVSEEGVTKYHTPHAVRTSHNPEEDSSIYYWIKNIPTMLGHTKKKAINYEKSLRYIYEDRQSGN